MMRGVQQPTPNYTGFFETRKKPAANCAYYQCFGTLGRNLDFLHALLAATVAVYALKPPIGASLNPPMKHTKTTARSRGGGGGGGRGANPENQFEKKIFFSRGHFQLAMGP